jgi:predicted aspartyl protease
VTFLLPVILALWMRSVLARRTTAGASGPGGKEGGGRPRFPSSVGTIAVFDLLLLALLVTVAPSATRAALSEHGSWWVERIARAAGGSVENPIVRGARDLFQGLASWIPGAPGGAAPTGRTDGGPEGTGVPRTIDGGRGGGGLALADAGAGPARPAGAEAGAAGVGQGGEVSVVFEKKGSGIVVEATLEGPTGAVKAKMLFDTGATLTTLDHATLVRLGVRESPDDPTAESLTANGVVRRRLVVLDALSLGGARVDRGLAVSVCDVCASGEVVGLLGLNYSRHFLVTLDQDAGKLLLRPNEKARGHLYDIKPFVDMSEARGLWRGPLLTVDLVLHNQSSRPLRNVRLVAETKGEDGKAGRIWGEVKEVPAKTRLPVKLEGLSSVKGAAFSLQLDQADW